MARLSQGPRGCGDLAPLPCWLTKRKNIPTAINRASRIPTINEATQCRHPMGFDPAPFCAAPMPNQKRRLPIPCYQRFLKASDNRSEYCCPLPTSVREDLELTP